MNRKDRRAFAKRASSKSMRKANGKVSFKEAYASITETYKLRELEEGESVLLSSSWIKSQPDYKFQPKEFWEWLEANNNGVFHVEYDQQLVESGNPDYKKFVCLKEDETNPKWVLRSDALVPVTVKLDEENKEETEETEGEEK